MQDVTLGFLTLVIPYNADPSSPAIIIGTDTIPPELVTYYGGALVSAIIYRSAAGNYTYRGVTAFGSVEGSALGGVVAELFSENAGGVLGTSVQYGINTPFDIAFGTGGFVSQVVSFDLTTFINNSTQQLNNGFPPPRGVVDFTSRATASGFGAAEFAVLNSGVIDFLPGNSYLVEAELEVAGTVANAFCGVNIRRTNAAGPVLRFGAGVSIPSNTGFAPTVKASAIVKNATAAIITDILVLTISPGIAGNVQSVAAANRLTWLRTTDLGPTALGPYAAATPL